MSDSVPKPVESNPVEPPSPDENRLSPASGLPFPDQARPKEPRPPNLTSEPDEVHAPDTLGGLDGADLLAQARASTAAMPQRTSPPAPADLVLPDLVIESLIGQGGMGAVYKARQKRLDRIVAVKVLATELGRDPAFAARFEREAIALARLNHPNLVTIHDVGRAGEWCYLVMEFVDGATLREVLRTGRLSPAEALGYVPQLCDALQYAHDAGVVHRDIKPENILIDHRGRVKIADFGLAKLTGQAAGEEGLSEAGAALTNTGSVLGTVHYMAPEQVEGSRHVDHRADIYSLGVVIYEMLTGSLPLGRFEPPSRKVEIDVRLDEVVLRILAKDPEQRFQKASQVQQAVDAAQQPAPAADQPVTSDLDQMIAQAVQKALHPNGVKVDGESIKLGNIEIGNGRVRIGDSIAIDEQGVRIGKRRIGRSSIDDDDGDDDGDEDDDRENVFSANLEDHSTQAARMALSAIATGIIASFHTDHWLGMASLFASLLMLQGAQSLYRRTGRFWVALAAYAGTVPMIGAWGVAWWLGIIAFCVWGSLVIIPSSRHLNAEECPQTTIQPKRSVFLGLRSFLVLAILGVVLMVLFNVFPLTLGATGVRIGQYFSIDHQGIHFGDQSQSGRISRLVTLPTFPTDDEVYRILWPVDADPGLVGPLMALARSPAWSSLEFDQHRPGVIVDTDGLAERTLALPPDLIRGRVQRLLITLGIPVLETHSEGVDVLQLRQAADGRIEWRLVGGQGQLRWIGFGPVPQVVAMEAKSTNPR